MEGHDERRKSRSEMARRLSFVLTGGSVERFHTAPTIKPNTDAQHSFGVAWLCYLISEGKPTINLLMAALSHDLGEQIAGDVPSPTKWDDPVLGERLSRLEDRILSENLGAFPLSPSEERTLKIADCLDGMLFLLQERDLGNRNAVRIFHRYRANLERYSMTKPQLDAFSAVLELWSEEE